MLYVGRDVHVRHRMDCRVAWIGLLCRAGVLRMLYEPRTRLNSVDAYRIGKGTHIASWLRAGRTGERSDDVPASAVSAKTRTRGARFV